MPEPAPSLDSFDPTGYDSPRACNKAWRNHLHTVGGQPLWKQFVMVREGYATGMDRKDAWTIAIDAFLKGERSDATNWREAKLPRLEEGDEESWGELAEAILNRNCSPSDVIRWVGDYMDIPMESIDPLKVPSSCALSLLRHTRASMYARNEFWKLYAKLLPKQSDIGREETKMKQSGSLNEQIDALLKKVADADTDSALQPGPQAS